MYDHKVALHFSDVELGKKIILIWVNMVVQLVTASLCEGEIILIIVSVPIKGALVKLHNEELPGSCCSLYIIRIIKGCEKGGGKQHT